MNDEECQLWAEVYVAAIRGGRAPIGAQDCADNVVKHFRLALIKFDTE